MHSSTEQCRRLAVDIQVKLNMLYENSAPCFVGLFHTEEEKMMLFEWIGEAYVTCLV